MIELKRKRTSKCERLETGEGHLCGIAWGPIIGAGIGAAAGFFNNKSQNEANREAVDSSNQAMLAANQNAGLPRWADKQLPYVFEGQGWDPFIPQMGQGAQDFGQAIAGGYNPAMGAQGPMGFGGLLEQSQGQGDYSQLAGLLGYGQGAPPALYPDLMGQQQQQQQQQQQPPPAAPGGFDQYNQWRGDKPQANIEEYLAMLRGAGYPNHYSTRSNNPYGDPYGGLV